jgi:hypothetical protein
LKEFLEIFAWNPACHSIRNCHHGQYMQMFWCLVAGLWVQFTGRVVENRRWSEGIHQAVEAKEGLQIQVSMTVLLITELISRIANNPSDLRPDLRL